jgi:hypothetical protein
MREADAKQRALVDQLKAETARLRDEVGLLGSDVGLLTAQLESARAEILENAKATAAATAEADAGMMLVKGPGGGGTAGGSTAHTSSSSSAAAAAAAASSASGRHAAAAATPARSAAPAGIVVAGSKGPDFDTYRERLKALFKSHIELFRTVVYRLTGWTVRLEERGKGWCRR